ncbi:MAG: VWA domain-containing protein [Bryobacteraceae bacterium]
MHPHIKRLAAVAFWGLVWPAAAQPAPSAGDDVPVFRSETRLVVLHATVVDKSGRLVTNLPQSAFKVYENRVQQQLRVFRREDIPVSMGIIIDNSGSMRQKRQKVESAALGLVKASNPQDEVFIVNFNDDAYLDVPFTSDINKMKEGLARIDSRGGTAMRDAISMSIDEMKARAKKDKKILFVVTDGNDNTSAITLERLVEKVRQSEILIYALALLNEEDRGEAKKARRALEALAAASGGTVYYPKDLVDVEKLALDVAHEIRNQYVLAYSPLNAVLDGSFRQIRVTVDGPGRPTVRTRNGYYATPDPRPAPALRRPAAAGQESK